MKVIVCIGVAVFIHIVLGWEWTLAAGILCGLMMERRGWLGGAICVASGWGVLVLINYFAAPEPLLRMLDVTGQIMGNLPGAMIVVLTILIGGAIGLLGGLIGTQLVQIVPSLRLYKQQTV